MKGLTNSIFGLLAVALSFGVSTSWAQSLEGRWDATLKNGGNTIPFRLDISGEGATLKGTLYSDDEKEFTTSASFKDGVLVLDLEHYLTKITATLKNGELDGKVQARGDKGPEGSAFRAKRYVAPTAEEVAKVPDIAGVWEIPQDKPTAKGEKSQRLIVKQNGAEAAASILRVDGDTGALTGTWKDGKFALSHFDGSRPGYMEITPLKDGTLQVQENGRRAGVKIAYRPEVARAKGLPEPEDYTTHTTMRDPNEVFAWKFPDVAGKIESNEDPKYKGKVVLYIVTGTWCPNCHDEAQYLVQLYPKYHDKGLEIVALDFEEPEQQDDLQRVHAFIKQYGVPYTYIIAGAPVEMWEKVPQAVNLNTWPATLFAGRDGRIKHIHTGFASPASGVFNEELKREFTSTIEQLLAENEVASR